VFCEYPPMILNAIPNVQVNNETSYKTGTEIEYTCDIGYADSASKTSNNKIYCSDEGKWTEMKMKCTSNSFILLIIFNSIQKFFKIIIRNNMW
jgi:hypothetical protein